MLTHEQLEVAARKLAELAGADSSGQMMFFKFQIESHENIADAIAHARGPATFNMDGTATVTALAIARGETAGEQRKNVPREPTEAMTRAGLYWADHGGTVQDAWRAMWDAYQEPTK